MNVKLDVICKIDDNGALTRVRIERVFEQITGYEKLTELPCVWLCNCNLGNELGGSLIALSC